MPSYSSQRSYTITKTNFTSTGTMASPYTGQTTTPGSKTTAGINAINKATLILSDVGYNGIKTGIVANGSVMAVSGSSLFSNLDNAIVATGCATIIDEATFSMIANSLTPGTTRAIDVSGSSSSTAIRFCNFDNCETGIYTANSITEIKYNTFDFMTAAIYVQSPTNQNVTIESNTITNCTNTAVDINNAGEATKVMVRFNDITVGTTTSTLINSYGIRMNAMVNLNTTKGNGTIAYNSVNLISTGEAVSVGSKDYAFITGNSIKLTNSIYNQKGIAIDRGVNAVVNCNDVNSLVASSNTQNFGFYFYNTQNPIITCNSALRSNKGIYFSSPCGTVKLVRNQMSDNNRGLELDGSAIIGTQPHRGNYWTGFGTTSTPYAAYNNNIALGNVIKYYPTGASINFKPADATISNSNTDNWFTADLSVGEKACNGAHYGPQPQLYNLLGDCGSPTPVSIDAEAARIFNYNDTIIATDTVPSAEFVEETNQELKRQLYEKLLNDPEIMEGNEVFEDFYDSFNSEPAGEFIQIDFELENAEPTVSLLIQTIEQNNELIENYIAQVESNLNEGLIEDNEIFLQNISNLSAMNEYLNQLIEDEELLKVQFLRNTNQNIETLTQMDENNALVYEVYFGTVAVDNYEFTNDQLDILNAIAHQCPKSGGPAVSLARNMYAITHPNEYYDDISTCLSMGYYRKASVQPKTQVAQNSYFVVYPNPAVDEVTANYYIYSSKEYPISSVMEIRNLVGQSVKTIEIDPNSREQKIDCSDLTGGVYFYSVIANKDIIYQGKITLIKQ